MGHQWEETRPEFPLGDFGRRCKVCGAEQHVQREYWWGRIVATRWRPLVGRCKRPETAADRLSRRRAETPEGRAILSKAYLIARNYPALTDAQCIRAAYWGVTGEP